MKKCILPFLLLLIALNSVAQNSLCDSLYKKVGNVFSKKDYRLTISTVNSALQSCSDTIYGKPNFWKHHFLLSYKSIAFCLLNEPDSAIIYGEKVVGKMEYHRATKFEEYYLTMLFLGDAYVALNKPKAASQCYRIGTDTLRKYYFGKENYNLYFQYLIKYAEVLSTAYNHRVALNECLWLSNELKKYLGTESAYLGIVLGNIGYNYYKLNRYDSALNFSLQGYAMKKKVVGEKHYQTAVSAANVGLVYSELGQYTDALQYFTIAKKIYETENLKDTDAYAVLLSNLGNCYVSLERYNEGAELLIQSLMIYKRVYGEMHQNVAMLYNNIGDCFHSAGFYRRSVDMYQNAVYIQKTVVGTNNELAATILNNLGKSYTDLKIFDSAKLFTNQSLDIKIKLVGKNHPSLIGNYNNLAAIEFAQEKFATAYQYFKQAYTIGVDFYGNYYNNKISLVNNMALSLKQMGQIQQADSMIAASYYELRDYVLKYTEGLTEDEKYKFASEIFFMNWVGTNLRIFYPNASLNNDWVYNSLLFYKGLVLESKRGLTNAFNSFTNPALQAKAKEYIQLKQDIGKELLKPVSTRSSNLKASEAKLNEYERDLLQASAEYRNWKNKFNISWQQIQQQLKEGEVAIEFTAFYGGIKKADSLIYAAYIIDKNAKEPKIVRLFNETDFNTFIKKGASQERTVKKLYRAVSIGKKAETQSDSLYYVLWKPLEKAIGNATTIYFSGDGIINNLNLAAIIQPNGKRLCEQYELVQMASTRNILNPAPQPNFTKVAVFGGVDYNKPDVSGITGDFSFLQGTLDEAEQITQQLKLAGKVVQLFKGNAASETAIKQNSTSFNVLHIATHGFFIENNSKVNNAFSNTKNPMLRSGFALANANKVWHGAIAQTGEDGILTAYEIAAQDFSNTQLVVLSACETGLGEIKSGEGVYGLQRAFKMAGVNYLIMSLWQVPDLETKEFMKLFYSYCTEGKPIRTAFRLTQLEMNKKYQPYQWAAFVLLE